MVRTRIPGEALTRWSGVRVADAPGRVGSGAGLSAAEHLGCRIGVLAVQGDVLEHLGILERIGASPSTVTRPGDLDGLEGLIIPGGESTTIGKLLQRFALLEPIRERIRDGMPVLGTCAGAILLGSDALLADGRPSSQELLGVLDTTARRNAFGRQVASFEGPVDIAGMTGGPMHGVFIRAPWFERVGPDVEVLATVPTRLGDKVVVVRQGTILACAFHPELSGDDRLHRRLVHLAVRPMASAHRIGPDGATP